MALKTQLIQLLLSGGIKTGTDDKILDTPNMGDVLNGRFTKEGVIQKRFGDSEIGATANLARAPNMLFSVQDRLQSFGVDGIYSFNAITDTWKSTNPIGPKACSVKVSNIMGTQPSIPTYNNTSGVQPNISDVGSASSNGFICHVFRWNGYVNYSIVESATGALVLPPTALPGVTTAATCMGDCRVVGMTNGFLIFAREGLTGEVVILPIGATNTTYTVGTVASLDTGKNYGGFDAHTLNGSTCFFAGSVATTFDHRMLRITLSGTTATVTHTKDMAAGAINSPYVAVYEGSTYVYAAFMRESSTTMQPYYVTKATLATAVAGTAVTPASAYNQPGPVTIVQNPSSSDVWICFTAEKNVALGFHFAITEQRLYNATLTLYDSASNYEKLNNYTICAKAFVDSRYGLYLPVVSTFMFSSANSAFAVAASITYPTTIQPYAMWNSDPHGLIVKHYSKSVLDDTQGTSSTSYSWSPVARFGVGNASQMAYNYSSNGTTLVSGVQRSYIGSVYSPQTDVFCFDFRVTTVFAPVQNTTTSGTPGYNVGFEAQSFSISECRLDVSLDTPLRSCATLNDNVLLAGGYLAGYDGLQGYEQALHWQPQRPWIGTVNMTAPTLAAGKWQCKVVFEWTDAQGNRHRSAPSVESLQVEVSATWTRMDWFFPLPAPSAKDGSYQSKPIAILYMTEDQTAGGGQLYYEVARGQPTVNATYPNIGHLSVTWAPNDTVAWQPFSRAFMPLYTDGGELSSDAPPSALDVATDGQRVYMVSGDAGNTVWASKLLQPGYAAEFNGNLVISVPATGGDVTAVDCLDEKVIIFKERAIYYFTGPGPSNTGQGQFSDVTPLSFETGCTNPASILRIPDGLLFFGIRGFYKLGRDLSITFVGLPIESYILDTSNVSGVLQGVHLPKTSEVVYHMVAAGYSSGLAFRYSYLWDQWSRMDYCSAVATCNYQERLVRAKSDAKVYKESTDYAVPEGVLKFKLVTPWIKVAGLQGYQRVRNIMLLGSFNNGRFLDTIDVSTEVNYIPTTTIQTKRFVPATLVLYPRQIEITQANQKCESIRITIEDSKAAGAAFSQPEDTTVFFIVSSILLTVGVKSTRFRHLPDGAKQ